MKYLVMGFCAVTLLIACNPKTGEIVDQPVETSIPEGDVATGEIVFKTDCAKCHTQKVVADHTMAQWTSIVHKMIRKGDLGDDKERQVLAYINWKLQNN